MKNNKKVIELGSQLIKQGAMPCFLLLIGGCVAPPDYSDGLLENVPAIVDETDYFSLSLLGDDYSEETLDFLKKLCLNHKNESFCEMRDDFKLYISIAKDACNCLPREVIVNSIFKKYRVKKSVFPRKSFYTL